MKSEVIVIGAGGHAKVCIEALRAMGETVAFCVGGADSPERCVDVPVLKGDENLSHLRAAGYTRMLVAVGSNRLRARLSDIASMQGFRLINAISPSAVVSPTVKLGVGIAIMAGSIVCADTVVDDLVIIGTGAIVEHDCWFGRGAHLAPQCAMAGNVKIGKYSFLGIGCKVIQKVEIGDDAVIGAGAVVISNIRGKTTAVGVPARVIKDGSLGE